MRHIEMEPVSLLPQVSGRLQGDGYSYVAYPGIVYFDPEKRGAFEQAVFAVQNMRRRYMPSSMVPTGVLLSEAVAEMTNGRSEQTMDQRILNVKRLAQINLRDEVVHPRAHDLAQGIFWSEEAEPEFL